MVDSNRIEKEASISHLKSSAKKNENTIKEEAFLTEGILAFRKAYLKRACWRGVWCNQI